MLRAEQVTKVYETREGVHTALKDVELTIHSGEIFALIGESGSGKSTFAELICRLQTPSSGRILMDDKNVYHMERYHEQVQLVFQNPDRSLNPTMKVIDLIAEPLLIRKIGRKEREQRAFELLRLVGLSEELACRLPNQLSGGQKQRVAIARALMLHPRLLIADEITSALDPLTANEIIQMLLELRQQRGFSILFITHQISLLRTFADRYGVMHKGTYLETGTIDELFTQPKTTYTQQLMSAQLISHPRYRK